MKETSLGMGGLQGGESCLVRGMLCRGRTVTFWSLLEQQSVLQCTKFYLFFEHAIAMVFQIFFTFRKYFPQCHVLMDIEGFAILFTDDI